MGFNSFVWAACDVAQTFIFLFKLIIISNALVNGLRWSLEKNFFFSFSDAHSQYDLLKTRSGSMPTQKVTSGNFFILKEIFGLLLDFKIQKNSKKIGYQTRWQAMR